MRIRVITTMSALSTTVLAAPALAASVGWWLVGLIAVQAFVAAQVGMRLGSHLAARARRAAGKFAGGLLVLAAALILADKLLPV